MFTTNRGFFCEAQGCRHRAPFKSQGALTNHQRTCKAFKEEIERDLQRWKKQRILEAEAEADRLRVMEAAPPTTSTSTGGGLGADIDFIVRSSVQPVYTSTLTKLSTVYGGRMSNQGSPC